MAQPNFKANEIVDEIVDAVMSDAMNFGFNPVGTPEVMLDAINYAANKNGHVLTSQQFNNCWTNIEDECNIN